MRTREIEFFELQNVIISLRDDIGGIYKGHVEWVSGGELKLHTKYGYFTIPVKAIKNISKE